MNRVQFLIGAVFSILTTSCGPQEGDQHESKVAEFPNAGNHTSLDAVPNPHPPNEPAPVRNTVPNNWQQVDASGYFTFLIPEDMVELYVRGVDSYIGAYRNDKIVLLFDYGRYSGSAKNLSETIDGKNAKIIDEKRETEYDGQVYESFSQVRFEDIDEGVINLTMYAYFETKDQEQTVHTIFRTLDFRK